MGFPSHPPTHLGYVPASPLNPSLGPSFWWSVLWLIVRLLEHVLESNAMFKKAFHADYSTVCSSPTRSITPSDTRHYKSWHLEEKINCWRNIAGRTTSVEAEGWLTFLIETLHLDWECTWKTANHPCILSSLSTLCPVAGFQAEMYIFPLSSQIVPKSLSTSSGLFLTITPLYLVLQHWSQTS